MTQKLVKIKRKLMLMIMIVSILLDKALLRQLQKI